MAALIALALGSYVNLNLSSARLAKRTFHRAAAFGLAEAGAEEALWSFNQANALAPNAWADWTRNGPTAWRKFNRFDFGNNSTGNVRVYVDNTTPGAGVRPTIVALASVESPDSGPVEQMLEIILQRRSPFSSGLLAKKSIAFSGARASADSWNSDPDADPATPAIAYGMLVRNDKVHVASGSVLNTAVLVNNAAVWGSVSTGGSEPEVGPQGSIRGKDTPDDVRIDPNRVATDFVAEFPNVTAPTDGIYLAKVGPFLGFPGLTTKWRCPGIVLKGNETLTILGHVTLVLTAGPGTSGISVTGNAAILIPPGSSLAIHTEADIKIGGNGVANANVQPISLRIFGTNTRPGGQDIDLVGRGALKATVYAPNAAVTLNGNGDMMGAVVAETITLTGEADFHYDEALALYDEGQPFGVSRWRMLATAEERERHRQALGLP
ncbi:MAG TPA: hypothetical protein VGD81_14980 [Opitutaceae bacterium]